MSGLKDMSPLVPPIGSIFQSSLLQRRVDSREALDSTYQHFEDYDNIPEQSITSYTNKQQKAGMWYFI